MILDITSIYHETAHTPQESVKCQETNAKYFVDDNILHVTASKTKNIQEVVMEAISKLETYTNSNLLALNPEKSRVMIVSKSKTEKENFRVNIHGKELHHEQSLNILGNIFTSDLTWDLHINKIVLPSLANRIQTLRNITKFMDQKFRRIYANAIFHRKVTYVIDAWGGAGKTLISKVQNLQNQAAKVVLGYKAEKMSHNQRLNKLKWPTVNQEVKLATLRMTHGIIYRQTPEELSTKMPLNMRCWNVNGTRKLDTKPKHLNSNKLTQGTLRNRSY